MILKKTAKSPLRKDIAMTFDPHSIDLPEPIGEHLECAVHAQFDRVVDQRELVRVVRWRKRQTASCS